MQILQNINMKNKHWQYWIPRWRMLLRLKANILQLFGFRNISRENRHESRLEINGDGSGPNPCLQRSSDGISYPFGHHRVCWGRSAPKPPETSKGLLPLRKPRCSLHPARRRPWSAVPALHGRRRAGCKLRNGAARRTDSKSMSIYRLEHF